jgi:hypothetical protein
MYVSLQALFNLMYFFAKHSRISQQSLQFFLPSFVMCMNLAKVLGLSILFLCTEYCGAHYITETDLQRGTDLPN